MQYGWRNAPEAEEENWTDVNHAALTGWLRQLIERLQAKMYAEKIEHSSVWYVNILSEDNEIQTSSLKSQTL